MATKLVGANDATGSNWSANYFSLTRFQAEASGSMTEFRLKCNANGNVKCAVYADNSGEPGDLITAMNTGQAVTSGSWNTLNFTPTSIASGTYYWLAICFDTNGAGQYAGVGTTRYKGATYSTFTFPNPAGTGFSNFNCYFLIAGWGVDVVVKTSSDNGSGADAFLSLETGEGKISSDAGSGVEGTPLPGATLAGGETGSGIEAIIARLLANFDAGYSVEASSVESGVLENLFASELGEGLDSLVARIERPDKGGGMKLWT
jgi:hypothetical protein